MNRKAVKDALGEIEPEAMVMMAMAFVLAVAMFPFPFAMLIYVLVPQGRILITLRAPYLKCLIMNEAVVVVAILLHVLIASSGFTPLLEHAQQKALERKQQKEQSAH